MNLRFEEGPAHFQPPSRPAAPVPAWFTSRIRRHARTSQSGGPGQSKAKSEVDGSRGIPHADQGVKQRNSSTCSGSTSAAARGRRPRSPPCGSTAKPRPSSTSPRATGRCRSTTRAARDDPPVRRRDPALHRRAADAAALLALHGPALPGAERLRRSVRGRDARAGRRGGRARTATATPARGKPPITPYTQRATEVHLAASARDRGARGARPGDGPARRARRAPRARARRSLHASTRTSSRPIPKATLALLGLGTPFKKHLREREARARILEALSGELRFGPGVWRERCIQSDHLFEAVICAFTGFLWARDGWALPAGGPAARRRRPACATAGSGRRRPRPRADEEKSAAEG